MRSVQCRCFWSCFSAEPLESLETGPIWAHLRTTKVETELKVGRVNNQPAAKPDKMKGATA